MGLGLGLGVRVEFHELLHLALELVLEDARRHVSADDDAPKLGGGATHLVRARVGVRLRVRVRV